MKQEIEQIRKELQEVVNKFNDRLNELEVKEQPFKNGDVVRHDDGPLILITNLEKGGGYGFNSYRIWNNSDIIWYFKSSPKDWQLATQEEWLEALAKEAVKRELVKGNYALFGKSKDKRKIESSEYTLSIEGYLCNDIDILMKDGVWVAEVIKEETLEELGERFEDFYIKYKGTLSDAHESFFIENKETINRLSK